MLVIRLCFIQEMKNLFTVNFLKFNLYAIVIIGSIITVYKEHLNMGLKFYAGNKYNFY